MTNRIKIKIKKIKIVNKFKFIINLNSMHYLQNKIITNKINSDIILL